MQKKNYVQGTERMKVLKKKERKKRRKNNKIKKKRELKGKTRMKDRSDCQQPPLKCFMAPLFTFRWLVHAS